MYFVQMMKTLNDKGGFAALSGLLAHDLLPMCLVSVCCSAYVFPRLRFHCLTLSLFLHVFVISEDSLSSPKVRNSLLTLG